MWNSVPLTSALRQRSHGKTHRCSGRKALRRVRVQLPGQRKGQSLTVSVPCPEGTVAPGPCYESTPDQICRRLCQMTIYASTIKSKMQPSGLFPSCAGAGCDWGLQGLVSVPLRLPKCAIQSPSALTGTKSPQLSPSWHIARNYAHSSCNPQILNPSMQSPQFLEETPPEMVQAGPWTEVM